MLNSWYEARGRRRKPEHNLTRRQKKGTLKIFSGKTFLILINPSRNFLPFLFSELSFWKKNFLFAVEITETHWTKRGMLSNYVFIPQVERGGEMFNY